MYPTRTVRVLDFPVRRVRRPSDLVLMLTSLGGIGVVLVLGAYATRTTSGVISDLEASPLQGVLEVVTSILLLPINVIEGWLTLILPVVVIAERLWRRHLRVVVEAIAAAIAAAILAIVAAWLITEFGPDALVNTLRVRQFSMNGEGSWVMTVTPTVAALAALLTASGTRDRRRLIALSWNLLWVVLAVAVLTRTSTIVGALVSVLIGRSVGLGMRYLSGVLSERAHGEQLVDAIRRAGADPVTIIRMGAATDVRHMRMEAIATSAPIGYTTTELRREDGERIDSTSRVVGESTEALQPDLAALEETGPDEPLTDTAMRGIAALVPDSATVTVEREGLNRIYAVQDADGTRWDAVVLDRDRQVIGMLSWLWSAVRLRGFGRRNAVSLQQAADRAVLMTYAAGAAGVRSPGLRGIAESEDSVILLGEHVDGAHNLSDYTVEKITDDVQDQAWAQLQRAHEAGLSHRNLSAQTVLLLQEREQSGGGDPQVLISGWEQGDIASSTLSRRIDEIQLLMMFAVRLGAERACAAAARVLTAEQLAGLAPLLQSVALPPETQAEARRDRSVMNELRSQLVSYLPESHAEVQPIQLTRFSARTAVTVTVAIAAVWVLLTAVNFRDILTYIGSANPAWMIVGFGVSLLTYLGSAMGLVAFSPEKLGLWRTTVVQVAASVIAMVAPAGVGPAALNLRFLQKKGLATPMALATVALLQVSQFITTILLLVVIALVTGSQGALAQLPSGQMITILVFALVAVGTLFTIGPVRRWVMAKIGPTLRQVWPRVIWVIGQPSRLLLGIGGNLIMTTGFLAAFAATLAAFGQSLPLTTLAIVYLTGTAIGSAVPTPGGMGAVEGALTTGLRTAGIATAAAVPIAVMFRVLTFWIRVPLGWVALRHLQKRHAI